MNHFKSTKQIAALLLLLITVGYSCSTTTTTHKPTLADYTLGEKWVWKYKGQSTEGEVRSEGEDVKKIVNLNGALGMTHENDTLLVSDMVKPSKSKTPKFNWPLEVGKKWVYKSDFTSAVGVKGIYRQDAEVLSYKKVTVAAGTFMAYTIQYKGEITFEEGNSTKTDDVWIYAPAIKNFIKMTQVQDGFLYHEELIKYSNPNK